MNLCRLHAFTVEPTRTTDVHSKPDGGAVHITSKLRDVLNQSIAAAHFERRTRVDFQVDPATRSNEVRDAVMDYAFRDAQVANRSASFLAERLSGAMDLRSHPALFVLAAYENDQRRTLFLWIFPRDTAFRFHSVRARASIDILTDIFSQTSGLRKAAQFEGKDLRNGFLTGRVLDFQINQKSKPVADFWISRFLQCTLSVRADAGTRLVAQAFRAAIDNCKNPADQEALFEAIIALRRSRRNKWTPRKIADEFLDGDGKAAFLGAFPPGETQYATFEFRAETFDNVLRFRIFQLHTGVFVSSPLEEVGKSVMIHGDHERQLSCTGRIIEEKVRIQHA